jgi:hypothetical protein
MLSSKFVENFRKILISWNDVLHARTCRLFQRVHHWWLSVVLDHLRHAHQCAHPWIFYTIFLTQLSLITVSPYTRHNRWWISAALCSSARRNRITACTSQLTGVATVVFMFHRQLLIDYAAKMHEVWCPETKTIACHDWACNLALRQRVHFYQPIGAWFWNSLRIYIYIYLYKFTSNTVTVSKCILVAGRRSSLRRVTLIQHWYIESRIVFYLQ